MINKTNTSKHKVMSQSILIVDDDQFIREILAEYLQANGFHIVEAIDGIDGLKKFKETQPDIVLLDLHMPKLDGFKVLESLFRDSPDTQVIIISGQGTMEDVIKALRLGAQDYLIKPIHDFELLSHSIEKVNEKALLIQQNKVIRQLLEQQIVERNKELEQVKISMEQTYQQLLQSEKMASIGQLAAGVAHEINNPIGYVNLNLSSLKKYLTKLFSLIDSYEKRMKLKNDNDDFIKKTKQQYDYDYLSKDINDLVSESLDGLERVKKIIQDLKDFSHTDDEERMETDIHNSINSTLNVAHNEIKHKAKVIKNYGDLPLLYCNPIQLSQVFMNLFVNAAQAIHGFGVLSITTHFDGDNIIIELSDTGEGIPEEIQGKIFDPFFTTKKTGEGTGLGLPISYGIIKKHQGTISLVSSKGQGTCFTIKLPVNNIQINHHVDVVSG